MKIVLVMGMLLVSACLYAADEDPPLPFDAHMPTMSALKAQESGVGAPEAGEGRHGRHGRGGRHHGRAEGRHGGRSARHHSGGGHARHASGGHHGGHGRRRR